MKTEQIIFTNSEMNGQRKTEPNKLSQPSVHEIESEVSTIRKNIVDSLALAKRVEMVHEGNTVEGSASMILSDIHNFLSRAESQLSDPSLLSEFKKIVSKTDELRSKRMQIVGSVGNPPVRFSRVEREDRPLVASTLLIDAQDESDAPSGLETWLDNMFSNDGIYDEALKKLREQCVVMSKRNEALERNLDEAEAELMYWREWADAHAYAKESAKSSKNAPVAQSEAKRVQTDSVDRRVVDEKLWKHAVAKFIGSFDQFTELKVLLHWKMHVKETRREQSNSS